MKNQIVEGKLRTNPRGFGFVIVENKEVKDVFIPKSCMGDAIDGDIVEVQINRESSKGLDGEILFVIKRERKHFAAIVHFKSKNCYYLLIPIFGLDWEISLKTDKQLKEGDRIIVEIVNQDIDEATIDCKLIRYLSHLSDSFKDNEALIYEYNIDKEFDKAAIKEALKAKILKKDLKKRKDLTHLNVITIDPIGAKDFDDAISISQDKDKNFDLGVHITDVAHFVKPNTELDNVAAKRANSTYFPDECIPMLPHELSSNLCSLQEKKVRLTISVLIKIDPHGDVLDYKIVRSYIKSQKRLTYEKAKEILDSKKKNKYKKRLNLMVDLCHLLKKKRFERGSIDFAIDEPRIVLDDNKIPYKIEIVKYDITHQMIEEFMLKANEIVATHLNKQNKTIIYRIHEEPDLSEFKDFFDLCRSLNFKLKKNPSLKDIQALFVKAKKTRYLHLLSIAFIKNLKLALYSPDNIGHFGLALKHYTHFTSPIRRYTDLIVQRILFDEEDKDANLNEIANICSEKERLSFKAESSLKTLKKLRFLKKVDRLEHRKRFKATITKVKPFGIYFELDEFFVTGFLHVSELTDDFFEFYEEKLSLVGEHTGKRFFFGQKIKVLIGNIDLILLEASFRLC